MEPSQVMGDEEEECCSNESGWTMYIASSPDHRDEVDDENDKEKTDKTSNDDDDDGDGDGDGDDDDDDSITSDASSGHPTHLQLTCGSSMAQYKHEEEEPATKSPPDNRRVGRKRDEKTKIDMDQEWVLNSNSTESCSHAQSGAKVRKTH